MKNQSGKWAAGAVVVSMLSGSAMAAENITVFAAASLTNALQDIAIQYKQENRLMWWHPTLHHRRWHAR